MKKYEKPSLEIVKIKVQEDFADKNTTVYNLGKKTRESETLALMGLS